jgi:hypothetical protein
MIFPVRKGFIKVIVVRYFPGAELEKLAVLNVPGVFPAILGQPCPPESVKVVMFLLESGEA